MQHKKKKSRKVQKVVKNVPKNAPHWIPITDEKIFNIEEKFNP